MQHLAQRGFEFGRRGVKLAVFMQVEPRGDEMAVATAVATAIHLCAGPLAGREADKAYGLC